MAGCLATPAQYKELKLDEATEKQRARVLERSVSAHSILFHSYLPNLQLKLGSCQSAFACSHYLLPRKKPRGSTSLECGDVDLKRAKNRGITRLLITNSPCSVCSYPPPPKKK